MTPCTCHPGKTCASAASCAAARENEFGEAVSTEQKLREALHRTTEALEGLQGGCTDSDDGTVEAITVWCPELIEEARQALALPASAEQEPLFLLHTGALFGGERDEWDVEANSGRAVDELCDRYPGQTIGLYTAQVSQPAPEAKSPRCASKCQEAIQCPGDKCVLAKAPLPELSDEVFDVLSMARMVLFQYHKLYRLDSEQRLIDRIDAALAAKKGGV